MSRVIHPQELDIVERALLAGLFLSLPGFEALKNALLWSFLLYWLLKRTWSVSPADCLRATVWWYDAVLLAIVTLGFISSALSSMPSDSLTDSLDFLSIALLSIFLRRTRISETEFLTACLFILGGIAIALADGHFRLGNTRPTLHSVGHINQVAIYLGTAAAISAAIVWRSNGSVRYGSMIVLALLVYTTWETGSRNAGLGIIIILLLMFMASLFADSHRIRSLIPLGLTAVFIGGMLSMSPTFYERQISYFQSYSKIDTAREALLNTALLVGREEVLIGHGVGRWAEATEPESVQRIATQRLGSYSAEHYLHSSHGHNLVATWYVERGLIAVLLLIIFSVATALHYLRSLRNDEGALMPAAGLLALLSICIYGVGNTTLHHEHGLLALAIIGLASNQPMPINARLVEV
jgi:O-antigen ligase